MNKPPRNQRGWDVAVTDELSASSSEELSGRPRVLALLLAMAMFVLVVDTSLMNVSIAAVIHDLDTSVSGVQSAIALAALVSAAFILIGGKVGDLIGRKRSYVLALLGYAIGALAMTMARSLTPIRHALAPAAVVLPCRHDRQGQHSGPPRSSRRPWAAASAQDLPGARRRARCLLLPRGHDQARVARLGAVRGERREHRRSAATGAGCCGGYGSA
jgi:hypothetical protein